VPLVAGAAERRAAAFPPESLQAAISTQRANASGTPTRHRRLT
jgi:hypothetical protein